MGRKPTYRHVCVCGFRTDVARKWDRHRTDCVVLAHLRARLAEVIGRGLARYRGYAEIAKAALKVVPMDAETDPVGATIVATETGLPVPEYIAIDFEAEHNGRQES